MIWVPIHLSKLTKEISLHHHQRQHNERLVGFAFFIPDFRRIGKGNHRHEFGDMIILMILAHM